MAAWNSYQTNEGTSITAGITTFAGGNGDQIHTYVARPTGTGPYPGVVLIHHLPGWEGLRTPGRLVVWTTLLLGVLAAGAVSAFVDRARALTADRVPADLGLCLQEPLKRRHLV